MKITAYCGEGLGFRVDGFTSTTLTKMNPVHIALDACDLRFIS